jgi:hypothetical protein
MNQPGVLRFEYEGEPYAIEFSREHRKVPVVISQNYDHKVVDRVDSKYPYTTARVVSITRNGTRGTVLYTATTGCATVDKFTLERGRIVALRKLTKKVSKAFRKAIWTCYQDRFPPKTKKPKDVCPHCGTKLQVVEEQSVGSEVV